MTTRTTTSNGHHHHHHHPHYSSSTSSSYASIKGCCCCLFLLFALLILISLAVLLVVVLAVKPKKPQFDLQQVAVQYLGITANQPNPAAAASSASLSLNIRLQFSAENHNKVGIKYVESRFTVMYRGIPLGEGTVPAFYQPAHSVRQVETSVAVDRANLQQADAFQLLDDATRRDRVELKVLGDVRAKIRILSFDSPSVQVSVICQIVISPSKSALSYKQCGFTSVNF